VAAALLLTAPFAPMLFQGEEWAASSPFQYFTDHDDPELARAVVEGRRAEFAAFGWRPEDVPDPQAAETFERSRLDWDERGEEPHTTMLAWYRALIELRRREPDLACGALDVRVSVDEQHGVVTIHRGRCAVVGNIGSSVRTVPLPAPRTWEVLLASSPATQLSAAGVVVAPDSAAVLRRS
jgi:maltooligosyltrehalose trehalohydrolase